MSFEMKGIDVSHWQNDRGEINWNSVKSDGIKFVILKAGGSDSGFYKDKQFEKNYENAKSVGLNVGAYYFVGPGCTSTGAGEADAKRFVEILSGKQFEMPVYLDLESTPTSLRSGATDAAIAFCDVLEKAGYYAGIYASDISGFRSRLDLSRLSSYDKWVARYGSKPSYCLNYGLWQYGSTGSVNGIVGNVDMNTAYVDYPTVIKNSGMNGFSKASASKPVIEEIDYKAKYEEALSAITEWAKKCEMINKKCETVKTSILEIETIINA